MDTMNNLKMLRQTIRFQRAALQNSLMIISAVQQHGKNLLKMTLETNPWIPGENKKSCFYWADFYTRNLSGMTDLFDQNLANMERFTSGRPRAETHKPPKQQASAQSPEPPPEPSPTADAKKAMSEKTPEKSPADENEPMTKAGETTSAAQAPSPDLEKQSDRPTGKPPAEKKIA